MFQRGEAKRAKKNKEFSLQVQEPLISAWKIYRNEDSRASPKPNPSSLVASMPVF